MIKAFIIRALRALRIRRPAPDTFLIPAYAGLGNFIMATPMILELKQRVPGARIFLLTWPDYGTDQIFDAPVLEPGSPLPAGGSAPVAGVFLLNPGAPLPQKIAFFLRLRRLRFGHACIPFDACPPFVWWGFAMAGVGRIVGHTMESMGIAMGWTRRVLDDSVPVNVGAHESDIHLDLLDRAQSARVGTSPARDYRTHMACGDEADVRAFGLEPGTYIVVQLSAANARFRTPKLWDRDRWAEVIRALEAEGWTIVLPGDANEKPLVDAFVAEHGLSRCVNLAGRTTVREVSTVIRFARLLLVHDSGLMHIGNAHGTPLIALYGPTDWNFTAPKAPTSRILKANLPCQPCMARLAKTEQEALRDCPIAVQCMRDITVADVLRACREILREKS